MYQWIHLVLADQLAYDGCRLILVRPPFMPYCPNCAAELTEPECKASCNACGAIFGPGSSWAPTATRLSQPPAVGAKSSTGVRVVKAVVAVPLLLIGTCLLVLSSVMGSNGGELAAVPAVFCVLVGLGIIVSRSKAALLVSVSVGALLVLLLWGGLKIIGAAIYSR